jgi:hypothetical protein
MLNPTQLESARRERLDLGRVVTECAVYNQAGQYAFKRVQDDVYFGSNRAFYVVVGRFVYDTNGELSYLINGLWWYAPDGVPSYYQDREITPQAAIDEEKQLQAEEQAAHELAVLEAKKHQELKKRKLERERKSFFRNALNMFWREEDAA